MKDPNISIIVPIYNAEKYLHRCIDSILTQTFTDFEVLLIDDGSKDMSGEICDEYAKKDCRIRVFHKKNEGVSSARNVGLDEAKGKWIAFCDSDDWLNKDFISTLLSLTKDNVDIVECGYYSESINVRRIYPKYKQVNSNCLLELLFSNTEFYEGFLWTKLFRASIIQDIGLLFKTDFKYNEDRVFIALYLLNCNGVVSTNKCLYHYWQNDESTMSSLFKTIDEKTITELDSFKYLLNISEFNDWQKKYIAKMGLQSLCNFYRILYKNFNFKSDLDEYYRIYTQYCLPIFIQKVYYKNFHIAFLLDSVIRTIYRIKKKCFNGF